ncbi:putative chloride channel-like protein CLC-g [Hordeum vulgare subsp. vulgare]|uniref:Chloride channel protein n=1 Tax=Hordeum vulgare subsp. vulgare TaxID=112509 RepID=A0A8I7BFM1_HORVV|nr:putative chloride channel-like protein CLC-g [Hordeum vulgare subsp. vulgare]
MASTAPPREDLITEDDEQRPPLTRPLLHRSATNNISQVAMVGSKACPIESLDYEIIENDLFDQNWRTRAKADQVRYVVLKWTFCFAIGVITGVVGFLINLAVENVAGFKHAAVSSLMESSSYWTAFWVFAGANLALLLLATAITASVSPAAGGSGIPEVKAYLNGVDAPNIFSLRTLAVKVIGNIAAVSSSLHVGKAGPMVHTGACIAAIFGQGGSRRYGLTWRWLRYFKNDRDRRDLVTIGAGAGVSAAFRAPVGGVLFALESLSSWWRSALIWRSFFTTAVVAVVLRLFVELCGTGRCGMFGKGGLIMYDVSTLFEDLMTYHLKDIPIVVLIGVIGAVLGAFYNFLMIQVLRVYSVINERGRAHKLLLAAAVSVLTSCCVFGLPWFAPCRPCPAEPNATCGSLNKFRRFHCPPDHYNDLASLMLNINDDAIRNLYATGTNDVYHPGSMLAFFLASYVLGVLSYGVVAPSGLFVPIILTGATYGRLVAMLLGRHSNLDHGLVAILGSASFLGGTLRMTVSVCVIIVELTNNLLLLPLVMLVLLISKTVADSFNASIYDLIVRLKGLPYLDGHAEPYMRQLSVGDVVVGPLRSFNGVEKVGHIMHVLRTTGHHAFPVIDEPPFATAPVLYGLVLRAHLLVLLRKREFLPAQERYPKEYNIAARFEAQDFDKRGSGKQDTVDGVELSPEEMEMYIDLHPFTNASPYTVVETMSLAKALVLFREVGLRHLLVVPKACDRSPVVGILTRHDFMPEHILGLHPVLLGGRWKRLRWHKAAVGKYFRDLIVRLANCG